jgi:hypothetical protein
MRGHYFGRREVVQHCPLRKNRRRGEDRPQLPEKLNAFDATMHDELYAALDEAAGGDEVR